MNNSPVLIAVVPKSSRLAIAVFNERCLVYYKICSLVSRRQNRLITTRALIEYFIGLYRPAFLAIESLIYVQQQTPRLIALSEEVVKAALQLEVQVDFYSPVDVRFFFSQDEGTNKFKVANAIIELYPELGSYLNPNDPSPQQYGLLIFNAVALGLYAIRQPKDPS